MYGVKKILQLLLALFMGVSLTACQPEEKQPVNPEESQFASEFESVVEDQVAKDAESFNEKQSKEQDPEVSQIQLALVVDGQEILSETYDAEPGTPLLDVMEAHLDVQASDGFIESINGHSQSPADNYYWLYTVDGEPADVGADQWKIEDGQEIVWTLSKL